MKKSVSKSIIGAAIGGLAASFVMNQFQELMKKKDSGEQKGDDATVKTARAISQTVFNHQLSDDEKKWAGPAVHYGFGTFVGALYGALAVKTPVTRVGFGAGYGTAVWLVADELAVPALGLAPSPTETPLAGHAQFLAAHIVYGLTTELIRLAFLEL